VLLLMAQEDTDASHASREDSVVEPALRGGGLKLPGLKHWRLRRGLTQTGLGRRVDTNQAYISRIEVRAGGCDPHIAQKLAEVLEVDLQALRTRYEPVKASESRPARERTVYWRVHRTYVSIILEREVGSAYTALGERGLEEHCKELPGEGVLEVVSARKREAQVLSEILRDADLADPNHEVRLFLEAAVSGYPDQDIGILAAARSREGSEKGREELTHAMQELL
jgi:transcriptional regulator with XRE-family HTH domain